MNRLSAPLLRAASRAPPRLPLTGGTLRALSTVTPSSMPSGSATELIDVYGIRDSLLSMSNEQILEDLKAAKFVQGSGLMTVQPAKCEPSEATMVLLRRSSGNPYLIPPTILSTLADYTYQYGFSALFRQLVEYAVKRLGSEIDSHASLSSDTTTMAKRLLTLCARDYRTNQDLMLPLLEAITSADSKVAADAFSTAMSDLPVVAILGIMRLLTESPDMSRYLPFLDTLASEVLKKSPKLPSSDKSSGVGTWTMYRLVLALMEDGDRARALDLFKKLIEHERFPPAAMLGMDLINSEELQDIPAAFDTIMLMSIIRACQLFGWGERTVRVAHVLVSRCGPASVRAESDVISRVLHNNIMDLVAEGHEASLSNAVSLFKSCTENPFVEPPHRKVLDGLYDALHRRDMHASMLDLFNHIHALGELRTGSGSTSVEAQTERQEWRYPWPPYLFPQGEACISLLNYTIHTVRMPRAIKPFAEWHAERPSDLQRHHPLIPQFIALYSQAGFVEQALQIWSAFRNKRGAEMLVGNANTVSALIKTLLSYGKRAAQEDASKNPRDSVENAPLNQEANMELVERYRSAARLIAVDFTALNTPFTMAAHSSLTSIAHVNFLIGDLPKAFAALSTILDRRTIPDGYDVAVTVGGVAIYDARRAVQVLDHALGRGVEVGIQAWTAVLRQALILRDFELAETLLEGLASAGIELDSKVIDTVVRHGVDFQQASQEEFREFLNRSLPLLTTNGRRTWPSLALLCIHRAIDAELPEIAFRYWRSLLSQKGPDGTPESIGSVGKWKIRMIERKIAEGLVDVFLTGRAPFTWADGWKMCSEMKVHSVWHRAGPTPSTRNSVRVETFRRMKTGQTA